MRLTRPINLRIGRGTSTTLVWQGHTTRLLDGPVVKCICIMWLCFLGSVGSMRARDLERLYQVFVFYRS